MCKELEITQDKDTLKLTAVFNQEENKNQRELFIDSETARNLKITNLQK